MIKNVLENKEMVFKNWVKNIQAAAYNGAGTVDLTMYPLDRKISGRTLVLPFYLVTIYINNITLFKVDIALHNCYYCAFLNSSFADRNLSKFTMVEISKKNSKTNYEVLLLLTHCYFTRLNLRKMGPF